MGDVPIACSEPGCGRPAVYSMVSCRIHLADTLREQGVTISFEDRELAGLLALAVYFARSTFAGSSEAMLEPNAPTMDLNMTAFLDPHAVDWKMAQATLDLLGAELADQPSVGCTVLSPPAEFESRIHLSLVVAVPRRAVTELQPRLHLALRAILREAGAPSARMIYGVLPADGSALPSGWQATEESGEPYPSPAWGRVELQADAVAAKMAGDFITAYRADKLDACWAMLDEADPDGRLLAGLYLCVDTIAPLLQDCFSQEVLLEILNGFAPDPNDDAMGTTLSMIGSRLGLPFEGRFGQVDDLIQLTPLLLRRIELRLAGIISGLIDVAGSMAERNEQESFAYFKGLLGEVAPRREVNQRDDKALSSVSTVEIVRRADTTSLSNVILPAEDAEVRVPREAVVVTSSESQHLFASGGLTESPARTETRPRMTNPERELPVGLIILILATLGVAALVNGITGNATVGFLACFAFFGAGLRYGDRFLRG